MAVMRLMPRLWAAALSMFLTILAQIGLRAYHPPAAAITLLIALGAFRRTREDAWALIIGVLIMALAGEAARRWRISGLHAEGGAQ